MKGRIFEKTNSAKDVGLKSECLTFLDALSKQGTWGGYDSLLAITIIERVNIIILNEDGSCDAVNTFSLSRPRTLLLAYSSSDFPTTGQKNHYDSVVNITESFITKYTNDLTGIIKKFLVHKQANNVPIVID